MAKKRKPIDLHIFTKIIRSSSKAICNSIDVIVANIGAYLGPRASAYSQSKQDEVDYHKISSGRETMKAWNAKAF